MTTPATSDIGPLGTTLAERYQCLNNSFKDCCVFHLGARSGFFSEYNVMILGVLYCLRNRIRFELYSRDANFGTGNGWTDYFKPFFIERSEWIHSVFNKRFPKKGLVFQLNRGVCAPVLKRLYRFHYFTYDIWPGIWPEDQLMNGPVMDLPELGLKGSPQEIRRHVITATWRFNETTAAAIQSRISSLHLPDRYLGIHLRGGDKWKDSTVLTPDLYMKKLRDLSTLRDVVVMTDDYAVYDYLVQHHPDLRFHTFEDKAEQGYHHREFKKRRPEEKQRHYINLLASVEAMSRAEAFIGTTTSNIGMFLMRRLPEGRFHSIGDGQWRIPSFARQ